MIFGLKITVNVIVLKETLRLLETSNNNVIIFLKYHLKIKHFKNPFSPHRTAILRTLHSTREFSPLEVFKRIALRIQKYTIKVS